MHSSMRTYLPFFIIAFFLSASLLFSSSHVYASETIDDWPMLGHHLNHSGYSTSATPSTNNTQWSYSTGGSVDSSPAVVAGLVYVGSADDNVYCLNASTGFLLWSYTTGSSVVSCPAVSGGLVYIGSEDNNVYGFGPLTFSTGSFWNSIEGYIIIGAVVVILVGAVVLILSSRRGSVNRYRYQAPPSSTMRILVLQDSANNLLIISAVLLVVDVILFFAGQLSAEMRY
jgi:outer membrane protein assembly factor BamB